MRAGPGVSYSTRLFQVAGAEAYKAPVPPSFVAMLGFSLVAKCVTPVAIVIAVFLLGFLFAGCSGSSLTYADVYLVTLLFNDTLAASVSSNSLLTDFSLAAGYMAMCATASGSSVCSMASNTSALEAYSTIIVGDSLISLVALAQALSRICHPRLLECSLAMCLALLVMVAWLSVPLVPGKITVRRGACVVAAATALVWGLGAMLQHQAVAGARQFSEVALLGIVEVQRGARAEAMSWAAFAFILAASIGFAVECFAEMPRAKLLEKGPY